MPLSQTEVAAVTFVMERFLVNNRIKYQKRTPSLSTSYLFFDPYKLRISDHHHPNNDLSKLADFNIYSLDDIITVQKRILAKTATRRNRLSGTAAS